MDAWCKVIACVVRGRRLNNLIVHRLLGPQGKLLQLLLPSFDHAL
jgi:hypothetical protein